MLYTQQEIDSVLLTLGEIVGAESLQRIQQSYEGEGRFYHDFDHAIEVLSWVDRACEEYSEEVLQPFTHQDVRLAALFHDVVYTTAGSPTNERKSCDWMRREIGTRPKDSLDRISQLIMLTSRHGKLEAADVPLAGQVLLDSDLVSLGQHQWAVFLYNNANVVSELRLTYTEEEVGIARKVFFTKLLGKESIFLSDFFRSRFEEQARRNLSRMLANS